MESAPAPTGSADPSSEAGGERVVAALDLGTNSFHLVVARVRGSAFEVITREKDMVRLGHGGGDMKELAPDAIERGLAALVRMSHLATSLGASVRAVATSAIREAANADDFVRRARREAKVEIEVVSGIEEARLIHLGVLQSVPVFDRRHLVVDIGGGSTEVLLGEGGDALAARSFKLGAVRLTDRFFPGGTIRPGAVEACRSYARSVLVAFTREVRAAGFDIAVASSGTAETMARLVQAARGGEGPRTFNCFEFTRSELDDVVDALTSRRTAAARRAVPGLDPGRADIVVAGALILQALAHEYRVKRFMFSEGALREGVLVDTISRFDEGVLHHLRNVSLRSIHALAGRCDDDPAHSARVAALALRLFDDTAQLHGLPAECRDYLEAAALLANVGLVISHSKHHLHSYYVIRNSELTGLTDHEIALIALVARYHRKSAPKPSHPDFAVLAADDQRIVRVLAGLLRVAIGLDRRHDGRVTDVAAHVTGDRLAVRAVHRHGREIDLELYTANERAGLLADVLGMPVEVRAATG